MTYTIRVHICVLQVINRMYTNQFQTVVRGTLVNKTRQRPRQNECIKVRVVSYSK